MHIPNCPIFFVHIGQLFLPYDKYYALTFLFKEKKGELEETRASTESKRGYQNKGQVRGLHKSCFLFAFVILKEKGKENEIPFAKRNNTHSAHNKNGHDSSH